MPETAPETVRVRTEDLEIIRKELLRIGVRFERWHAARRLPANADDTAVMNAYRSHIDHVSAESGYPVVDIVRITPASTAENPPQHIRPAYEKYAEEHQHDEDVVRFLVSGAACFYLHVAGQVLAVLCTAGDLLSLPGRTTHWFDAGAHPSYTAIRFSPEGAARAVLFPPTSIAARFPTFDEIVAKA